jgi:indole-3-glycerol phosphate synthase
MTILEKIIENKKKELSILERLTTVKELEKSGHFKRQPYSLSTFIADKNKTGIIAEFKRKSPSKGIINSISLPVDVVSGYFREGASGVSILTDTQFFGGSLSDLLIVREKSDFPILRKDFIIDEYQVIESKSAGADVILLIAAVLSGGEILKFSRLAGSLGMEVLLEVHDPDELDKVNQFVNIIGVNNRNLKTFEVDIETSVKTADRIPAGYCRISESGISSPSVIKNLRSHGFEGFLMGERFMSSSDPVKSFSEFVTELKSQS